jgi:hypothetical protein
MPDTGPLPAPGRRRWAPCSAAAVLLPLLFACSCPRAAAAAKPCAAYYTSVSGPTAVSSTRDTGLGFKTVKRAGALTALPVVGNGQPCGHALGVCAKVSLGRVQGAGWGADAWPVCFSRPFS